MATYQAIAAVCDGVIQLLRAGSQSQDFGDNTLDFKVYVSKDFDQPMTAGVSLFPYRIFHNGVHRTPTGRISADGKQQRPQLPLELHFLLTAWGQSASLQNTVAGWMMRVLEDAPVLAPTVLNAVWPNVFRADETVEIVLGELSTQDLIHMWDVLSEHGYHLSVPYVARVIRVESTLTVQEYGPVRSRDLAVGQDGGKGRAEP